jgi:hypothetical protein
MDTDETAKQYMFAIKRLGRHCPDLVSQDKGSLVRSGGGYSIGPGACAPSSITALDMCVAAPRIELSQEFRGYHAVLNSLRNMRELVQSLRQAKVHLCWGML